jgi:hypothetical protein
MLKLRLRTKTVGLVSKAVFTLQERNWVQERRHNSRGSSYLFAPMVNFNVMAEVGETPP